MGHKCRTYLILIHKEKWIKNICPYKFLRSAFKISLPFDNQKLFDYLVRCLPTPIVSKYWNLSFVVFLNMAQPELRECVVNLVIHAVFNCCRKFDNTKSTLLFERNSFTDSLFGLLITNYLVIGGCQRKVSPDELSLHMLDHTALFPNVIFTGQFVLLTFQYFIPILMSEWCYCLIYPNK